MKNLNCHCHTRSLTIAVTIAVFVLIVTLATMVQPSFADMSTAPVNRDETKAFRIKSTTDPTFECSGCARTRLIGCFHGQCSYRCYRSCTNGNEVIIEAHRFVLEGQRKRRKRYID